jgi:hypothetical protein
MPQRRSALWVVVCIMHYAPGPHTKEQHGSLL